MLLCRKHKIDLIRQNSKHYYCPECDRLAIIEIKGAFKDNKLYSTIKKNIVKCITCGINFKAKTTRKKYCSQCNYKRVIESSKARNKRKR